MITDRSDWEHQPFDIVDHRIMFEKDYDQEVFGSPGSEIKNSKDHDVNCEFDVPYMEDRLEVKQGIILTYKANRKFCGTYTIKNRSGLNLSFFVKSSSQMIHIEDQVGYLLPKQEKVLKVRAELNGRDLSKAFFLIFVTPLYFKQQLNDEYKLKKWWNLLGTNLNSITNLERHKISIPMIWMDLVADLSMLDEIVLVSKGFYLKSLEVSLPNCIDIPIIPLSGYCEFWGLENETLATACLSREMTRNNRREELAIDEESKKNSRSILSKICMVLGSIGLLAWFFNEVFQNQIDPTYVNSILVNVFGEALYDWNIITRPPPPKFPSTWTDCFSLRLITIDQPFLWGIRDCILDVFMGSNHN